MTIYTIGHSTRTQDEVWDTLFANDVDLLVDIRSYPSSRHCPQWNQADIIADLPCWLEYEHQPALGGKRKALPLEQSVCGAWRNASFRGYGDYMQTPEFANGLAWLERVAKRHTVAIMCAEALWWKCHRSMVADALVADAKEVLHLGVGRSPEPHIIKSFAHVVDGKVTYPLEAS